MIPALKDYGLRLMKTSWSFFDTLESVLGAFHSILVGDAFLFKFAKPPHACTDILVAGKL
jgi:hypothetical protein